MPGKESIEDYIIKTARTKLYIVILDYDKFLVRASTYEELSKKLANDTMFVYVYFATFKSAGAYEDFKELYSEFTDVFEVIDKAGPNMELQIDTYDEKFINKFTEMLDYGDLDSILDTYNIHYTIERLDAIDYID